jgi:AcrR family transcriptional regulator
MEENNSKLGRQDWVNAALNAFVERGIEAVKVDGLAKSLNITRGSFYWHFKKLDDLLEAIIQEWRILRTADIIQQVEVTGGEPAERLLRLFELAAADDDRLEKAMRIWATQEVRAAAAIAVVDQQRLDYLQNLFLQMGFAEAEAKVRAQIAYSIRLGWFVIAASSRSIDRLTEIRLVHCILTRI